MSEFLIGQEVKFYIENQGGEKSATGVVVAVTFHPYKFTYFLLIRSGILLYARKHWEVTVCEVPYP